MFVPAPNADPNATGGYNYIKDIAFDQKLLAMAVPRRLQHQRQHQAVRSLQPAERDAAIPDWPMVEKTRSRFPYPTPILGKETGPIQFLPRPDTCVQPDALERIRVSVTRISTFPNVFQNASKVSRKSPEHPISRGSLTTASTKIPSMTGLGRRVHHDVKPRWLRGRRGVRVCLPKKKQPAIGE